MGCPSYGSSAISVERCHPGLRRCEDGISAEAFYLVRDELPEATTGSRLLGFNYELSLGKATTLGATYLRAFAHADQKPTRDGLNVYNLRAFTAPFSSLPGLSFEAEYAREHNGSLLDSTAWTIQGGYELGIAWKPRLSYRFAFFQGDDPGTSRSEAFDPLFVGSYDWGTWSQGEIASFIVSNSNLISHQVRLHLAPSSREGRCQDELRRSRSKCLTRAVQGDDRLSVRSS